MPQPYRTRLAREQREVRREILKERLAAFYVVVGFPVALALLVHLLW